MVFNQWKLKCAKESNEYFSSLLASASHAPGWDNQAVVHHWQGLFKEVPEKIQLHSKEICYLLITALTAPWVEVYQPAAYILEYFTEENFGFRVFGDAESRLSAADRWLSWWNNVSCKHKLSIPELDQSTLTIDEIPGRIHGDDDNPPGRVYHIDKEGNVIWDMARLKMPYDAIQYDNGNYLVNIIRERAVWNVNREGEVDWDIQVGGYPCSLDLLPNGNILVAGWDDDVPGFVREFDTRANKVWSIENLRWPWKAQRLVNGNTLIADAGTKRVFEVSEDGSEIWAINNLGPRNLHLFDALGPVYCQRLMDGNTLVSIRGLSKVVELDPEGNVMWELGDDILLNQYSAIRLWNGNTLIADGGHFRVIEVDISKSIIWEKTGFGYPAKAYRY